MAMLALCSAIVGAATAYLRLYVGSEIKTTKGELVALLTSTTGELGRELLKSREQIMESIKEEFASRELTDLRLKSIEERLGRIERKVGNDAP
jgi:hypothetical protein